MKKALQHLDILISSQEALEKKGDVLTQKGIDHLNGLRSARKLFTDALTKKK
jgi:hypothetical protein